MVPVKSLLGTAMMYALPSHQERIWGGPVVNLNSYLCPAVNKNFFHPVLRSEWRLRENLDFYMHLSTMRHPSPKSLNATRTGWEEVRTEHSNKTTQYPNVQVSIENQLSDQELGRFQTKWKATPKTQQMSPSGWEKLETHKTDILKQSPLKMPQWRAMSTLEMQARSLKKLKHMREEMKAEESNGKLQQNFYNWN